MTLISRPRRIDSSIDLTPLIDVVFQLLIFLMVSSQFTKPESVVDLPQVPGDAPSVSQEVSKIALVILADGGVLLDGTPIEIAALGAEIRRLVDEAGLKRAEIRGDQLAHYGVFVEVMEIARTNGVESLGIVKKRREEGDGS